MIKTDQIPHFQIGSDYRFNRSAIVAWTKRGTSWVRWVIPTGFSRALRTQREGQTTEARIVNAGSRECDEAEF